MLPPEIYFRLMWEGVKSPFEKIGDNAVRHGWFLHAEDGVQAEIDRFCKTIQIANLEILYLYGLGLGVHFIALKEWLAADLKRKLVIFEDDLAVIDAALRFGAGEEVFSHPQVDLHFIENPRDWGRAIEQCVKHFASMRWDFVAIESYAKDKTKKKVAVLRLKLLRQNALVQNYFNETIFSHHIHANLLKNVDKLIEAFDGNALRGAFPSIPAILCGAGPSLENAIPMIKTLQDRALIFAGGSTVTALGAAGIVPHIALAIDPNEEEYDRFKKSVVQEIPFLYGHRLHPRVFDTLNAPLGYLRTQTEGNLEPWIEKSLGLEGKDLTDELGPQALSITTLGLALAHACGCDPIILVGVDLAYTDLKRYAPGILPKDKIEVSIVPQKHLETILKRKNGEGKTIYTLLQWVMEKEVFARFAKKHKKRKFFNQTEKGLPIPGMPYISIEEFAKQYCPKQFDLLGKLHQKTQKKQFSVTREQIVSETVKLKHSLGSVAKICERMLEEIENASQREELPLFPTGKMIALEMEFEEELSFEALFASVDWAVEARRKQQSPSISPIELAREKWQFLSSVTDHYLKTMPR